MIFCNFQHPYLQPHNLLWHRVYENGNMMVEVEDVEVDTDGKLTVKKYEGYKDENDEMHLEEVVEDSSGTESENNESSLSEYIVQDDSELPTETLSIDEVNQLQQDTLDGMDAILHQDTIDMMRMSVKTDVKKFSRRRTYRICRIHR